MKKIINFIISFVFVCFFVLTNISTTTAATTYTWTKNATTGNWSATSSSSTKYVSTYNLTNYYSSVNYTSEATFRSTMHTILTTNITRFAYSNTAPKLKIIDTNPTDDSKVICMYTGKDFGINDTGSSGTTTWNKEHTWAKSHGFPQEGWYPYTDLNHLRVTECKANSTRSNYDFGVVVSASNTDSYGNKLGAGSDGKTYYEPRDAVKGDVARILLYMDLRYEGDSTYDNGVDLVLTNGATSASDDTLGKLGDKATLLKWAKEDPVDDLERRRNDLVYGIQGNRNPFIDNPSYMDFLYGTSYGKQDDSITYSAGGYPSTTTYNVTFNANGGTFGSSSTKTYSGVTTLTIPSNPTKTGYTFVGWNTSSSASVALTLTSGSAVTANTTYYAVWKESSSSTTYNVTFNANGGTFGSSSTTTYSNVTTLSLPYDPTRTGYTFVGWNTSNTATTALTLTEGSAVTANTTYYAVWKANSVTPQGDEITATYTIASQTSVTPTNAPNGSSESFSNSYSTKEQLTAGQTMSLTLSGYDDLTIKSIVFSMHSNASKGSGYYSITCGSNNVATLGSSSSGVAFNDESFNGNWTTTYTNVTPSFTAFTVGSGDNIVITIGATANSLYCQSFSITYEQGNKYSALENSFKEITLLSQLVFDYVVNTSSTGQSGSVVYNTFKGSGAVSGLSTNTEYDFSTYCNYDTSLFDIKLFTNDKANFYSNSTQIRLYHATNNNGNSLVFTGKTGITITDVTYVTSGTGITKTVDSSNNTITLQNTGSAYAQITSITISYTTGTQTTTYAVNSASIRMKYTLDSNLKAKLEDYAATQGKTLKFGICLDNGTFYECSIINNEVILVLSGIDSSHFKSNIGCYAAFKLGDEVVKATTIKSESVNSIATNYVNKLSADPSVQAHLGVLTYLKNL